MPLSVGMRLGPYEILAAIGAGGMGEVYRARDIQLKREVAIKVLPEAFSQDPDRLARFQREAELLATLNHPNIAHIYGFEESDGVRALVLELIEGPTIADRMAQGAVPLDQALPIAKQIAEALEAAHEQGIIHRDLKPANIKLRPDGIVKILDFGLAKALAPVSLISADITASPTITTPAMTRMGVILGTAAYMSPEQARGKPVDKRTDIWAFGCVLYEMLTGRIAFVGETTSDTIAKILEREPDWQNLPASTPARIRDLLRRCLHKDQQRRLHDIADARIEIEEARTGLTRPRRVVGLPIVAAAVALVLAIVAGAWWNVWRPRPSVRHRSVSVLIADFQNDTDDPTFDRTLEPLLKIVLEGAGFVTAYDRTQVSRSLGVPPPEKLDERAALELAVKQGVGVVLSGSLDRQGSSYGVVVKATQAVTGKVITSAQGRPSNKDQVLGVATKLATAVREALGDDTSDSAQRFAMETLSATSLEAVHDYAVAMEAVSNSRFDEARRGFLKAVERDPKFGLAWAALGMTSRNLDKQQDAEKYVKEAVRHLDGMTERERYRTRGNFYMVTGDYSQCVKEYSDLIARYTEDVAAHNNLALCSTYLRNMPRALDEMRRVVGIMPRRALYRINLALYAAYGGDFQMAEQEARRAHEQSPWGLQPLAFAQIGQGQVSQAIETYQQMGEVADLGPSYSSSGLGDIALYEGRLSDAARILEQGAAADLTTKDSERAANKFAALAYAQVLRRKEGAAIAAADKALANSNAVKIRFLAARVFVEAGAMGKARTLAVGLASELQGEPQAYAKIVDGEAALKNGDARQAITILAEANTLLDTWMGHFDLGRAYLEAGSFTQADSEFDRCIRRRGETLSLFLDEEPTYSFFPPVFYYQGRVREGLNNAGFAESYRMYLKIRGKSTEDPLAQEVRQRVDH
jgi:serine/threonine protein kinase/tetratricopeptide (TPR) repeat protein